jgi:Group II intron, maturase-specific domain
MTFEPYADFAVVHGSHEHTSFTFLGFEFRAWAARGKNGTKFASFLPAASKDALKKISATVRSWWLHRRTGLVMDRVAREINLVAGGWMQYYGAFSAPRGIPSCGASTPTWCAGSARNTGGWHPGIRQIRCRDRAHGHSPVYLAAAWPVFG